MKKEPRQQPTHRDLYPSQYTDPLCGLRVAVGDATRADGTPLIGIVARVVPSRWGPLAILEDADDGEAWPVADCRPVDCHTLNGIELTLSEFLRDNPDLGPEDVEAVRRLQPGEEMQFGGGAGGLFVLRRELPGWPGRPRVADAGHTGLYVVRSPIETLAAGPFADRPTAAWNASMQERHWWRCPGTPFWFVLDEVSAVWMCHSAVHPSPADRPDFTSMMLATADALRGIAADESWIRNAFRQEHGRDLPANSTEAGWVFCPVIGWYVRRVGRRLEVTPPRIRSDRPLDEDDAQPFAALAEWNPELQPALGAWIAVTLGLVLDERFANAPSGSERPFHQYEARLAASRILAGTVGARLPEREGAVANQMVFAYIPVGHPEEYGDIDAIVVEPAESGAARTVDVCVGTGMYDERLPVPLDAPFGGDPLR